VNNVRDAFDNRGTNLINILQLYGSFWNIDNLRD